MNLSELERMAVPGIMPGFKGGKFAVWMLSAVLGVPALAGAMGQTPVEAPAQQLAVPTPAAITPNGQVVEDVIARVNDQIIDRSDLERAEEQLTQEAQQSGVSGAELEQRQKDLLRDLIDNQLLLSKGKDLGINADAEVIRQLDEIRKQNHLDTMEDLEKAARAQGVSFEDFKANIRNGIIRQEVVRDEVGRHLQLTPAEEQTYYEAHKAEYAQPEQERLSEILVPTPADASAAVVAQAQTKADGIEKQLKAGDKFEELAKTVSGGPTASAGGDLGLFKRGALAKVLEDQTFDLKAGEWTQPIRTRQGFVILKVTEHQAAGVPPLSAVEQQVQEAIYSEQMRPALRAYLTKLRDDAFLEIAPGLVDSGASPNETKPVFLASNALPVSKKAKKVKVKKRFDRGTAFSTVAAEPKAAKAKPAVLKLDKHGKPKKVKREKIRFGQAPEQTLPPGPTQTASGNDAGIGASQAAGAGATLAPGTAIAPVEASSITDSGSNPLATKPATTGKMRLADKAPQIKIQKAKVAKAKALDKAAATPTPITQQEQAAAQVQAAPLGLNGDTAKKKKVKRKKGETKKRLKQKAKDATTPKPDANGLYPTPYHPTTTVPPAPAATPAPAPTTPSPN